jgi:hypothetical protein
MPLVRGQTSTATTLYSITVVHCVQSLYISHYVYSNKTVLASLFPARPMQVHLAVLKGADGQPIPSWGFISKTVQFQGTAKFLQATVAGPILGTDFLRKFRITVAPETCMLVRPPPPLPRDPTAFA